MNILQPTNTVFFVGLVVYYGIRYRFIELTKSEKKTVSKFDGLEKLLLAVMFPPVLLLPLLYLFSPWLWFADYELPEFIRWAGVLVMVASLWLFWRSHTDLGQNWSVSVELREHHELVTNGIYRRIRHPMYASIWLWAIAQGMILANWLAGWSVIPAFAAMYFIRLPREERLMHETFGESYRKYSSQTGRLFPRLGKAVAQSPAPDASVSTEDSSPPIE